MGRQACLRGRRAVGSSTYSVSPLLSLSFSLSTFQTAPTGPTLARSPPLPMFGYVDCQTGEILLARRATAKAGEIFRRGRTRTYFVKPFFPFRVAICLRTAEKLSPCPSLYLGLLSVPCPIIWSLVVHWWYAKAHDVNGTPATAKSARQEYKRGKSSLDG